MINLKENQLIWMNFQLNFNYSLAVNKKVRLLLRKKLDFDKKKVAIGGSTRRTCSSVILNTIKINTIKSNTIKINTIKYY